jgi:hypothetical protein
VSREKLLLFDGQPGKKSGRRFVAITLFMEGHVRFVHLKVLKDGRALTIASSLATIVSALAARNDIVAPVCIDNASEVPMLTELHMYSLSCRTRRPIMQILCVAHTADLALGDFLTESRGAKLCDIRRILAALPDYTGAPFSDIPRRREELWLNLGKSLIM